MFRLRLCESGRGSTSATWAYYYNPLHIDIGQHMRIDLGPNCWTARLRGGMSSPAGVAVRLGLGVAAAGLLGGLLSRWYKWKPSKKFGEPEEGWKRKTKAEKKLERYLKSKEANKRRDKIAHEKRRAARREWTDEEKEEYRLMRLAQCNERVERTNAVYAIDEGLKERVKQGVTDLPAHLRVAVDLIYDADVNRERELRSLCRQLSQCWNHARLAKTFESTPSLHLTSYKGQVVEVGRKQGLGQWKVHRHEEDLLDVFPRESIVYLSPDATDVLEEIDPTKVYVIGGIVDRSVKLNISLSRSKQLGVASARLPLHHVPEIRGKKVLVLNVDTVLQILVEFKARGSWKDAIMTAIPLRKLQYPNPPSQKPWKNGGMSSQSEAGSVEDKADMEDVGSDGDMQVDDEDIGQAVDDQPDGGEDEAHKAAASEVVAEAVVEGKAPATGAATSE